MCVCVALVVGGRVRHTLSFVVGAGGASSFSVKLLFAVGAGGAGRAGGADGGAERRAAPRLV